MDDLRGQMIAENLLGFYQEESRWILLKIGTGW
jgi:hypothetical protein